MLRSVLPAAGLLLAVLGSIFFGIATPTEAAGVGALGATLLAIGKRRLTGESLRGVLRETTRTTGFIFAILLGVSQLREQPGRPRVVGALLTVSGVALIALLGS